MTALAQSIRHKLQHLARTSGRPFQSVLQYYAMERFLHRLSRTKYADHFVLKGGLMLTVWGGASARPTLDIDLLGLHTSNAVEDLVKVVQSVCVESVEVDDGLMYDGAIATGSVIIKDAGYPGVRVGFQARLDTARVKMKVDIGFGDDVFPVAPTVQLPTTLSLPVTSIQGYPKETAIPRRSRPWSSSD